MTKWQTGAGVITLRGIIALKVQLAGSGERKLSRTELTSAITPGHIRHIGEFPHPVKIGFTAGSTWNVGILGSGLHGKARGEQDGKYAGENWFYQFHTWVPCFTGCQPVDGVSARLILCIEPAVFLWNTVDWR